MSTRAPLPAYAELHCLSNFSFLRGASHPDELVDQAITLGYRALALTDECSLAGVVRAHRALRVQREALQNRVAGPLEKGHPLELVIGSEFTLADGLKLVLLAVDRSSYGDLSQLITQGRRRAEKGHYVLTRDDVAALGTRCQALWVPGPHQDGARLAGEARYVVEAFGRTAAIAFAHHARGDEAARLAALTRISRASGLALAAAGDVHMHVRERRMLQDTLTAIRLRKPLPECGHALFPNGEHALRSRGRLATLYPPELMAKSVEIAENCRFSLDELRYEYPQEIVPEGKTPIGHLRDLVEAGALRRYQHRAKDPAEPVPASVVRQIEHEMALIEELQYEPFFLTVNDVVVEARRLGILCQGRGSAANSTVCYVLGITEVDPTEQRTLVGRFMSAERKNEPPDIDVDFEHQRREDIMQYVYNKYGRERTALAATVICYRAKSGARIIEGSGGNWCLTPIPPTPISLQLGLRMIKGLSEESAKRIVAARTERPFTDVADLAHRAALNPRERTALANGKALASLAGDRHRAAWKVAGIEHLHGLFDGAPLADPDVELEPPTEGQDLVADYRHLGYTLGRHPAALLRRQLAKRRLSTASEVAATPTGRIVRTAGIVIGRQRPGTAGGVVFVTLEDETGATNVIVWRDLGERQRKELLTARLMAVYGKVEREGIVVHLIAEKLVDLTAMLGPLETRSRDFH